MPFPPFPSFSLTHSHKQAIEHVVEAGLAIGIEKPVCDNISDIQSCYDLAKSKGVPLFCSFQRRTDPSYKKLLLSIRQGEIGQIRSIHAVFRDHPVPSIEFLKLGGDIFHDLVVHDADFIMHLLNETPNKVRKKHRDYIYRHREHQDNDDVIQT